MRIHTVLSIVKLQFLKWSSTLALKTFITTICKNIFCISADMTPMLCDVSNMSS